MSQAEKPNTMSPSRRALLAGAPAAAAAALAGGTIANAVAKAGEVDPIFALIEAYDRAASQETALYQAIAKLEEALPRKQTSWHIHFGGEGRWPPEACTDAPEWLNVQLAMGEVSDRMSDQMLALLTTAPTTIDGVAALLERLEAAAFPEERDHPEAESLISTMGQWYDERVEDAADAFHFRLATALRNTAARGQS
jgi:hypothetical protein